MTTLPSSVSLLLLKCGSLDFSQSYGPPWPVTGIALPYILNRRTNSREENKWDDIKTDLAERDWMRECDYLTQGGDQ
jgi:hypothetical protein